MDPARLVCTPAVAALAAVWCIGRFASLACIAWVFPRRSAAAGAGADRRQYLHRRNRQNAVDDLAGANIAAGRLYAGRDFARLWRAQNSAPQASAGIAAAKDVGDEPLLIAYRAQCPVVVGRDRVAAATALLAAHPQVNVIVSDDGLQHYRLARDIEIVLFDARGTGNGWLLPAGPLREPPSRRRDFTVVNGSACRKDARLQEEVFQMHLSGVMAEPLASSSTEANAVACLAFVCCRRPAGFGRRIRGRRRNRQSGALLRHAARRRPAL